MEDDEILEDGTLPIEEDEEEDAPEGTFAEEDTVENDEEDLAKHGLHDDDDPVTDF